jgi:hypothetical protein
MLRLRPIVAFWSGLGCNGVDVEDITPPRQALELKQYTVTFANQCTEYMSCMDDMIPIRRLSSPEASSLIMQ